jgi:transcriptional regulator with XRE-family HTH domain
MSDLYERIDRLCKDRNINITVMCKESGASRGSLSDLKFGRKQNLSVDTLSKIASYFDVTVDYLTGKENSPDEFVLTEGEKKLILLFRKLPADLQESYPVALEMTLKAQGLL